MFTDKIMPLQNWSQSSFNLDDFLLIFNVKTQIFNLTIFYFCPVSEAGDRKPGSLIQMGSFRIHKWCVTAERNKLLASSAVVCVSSSTSYKPACLWLKYSCVIRSLVYPLGLGLWTLLNQSRKGINPPAKQFSAIVL